MNNNFINSNYYSFYTLHISMIIQYYILSNEIY